MDRVLEQHDQFILAQLTLFMNVSFEAVEIYLDSCPYITLEKGEILLSPDEKNKETFIVISGRLAVHLDSVDTLPLTYISSGECAGEMSILNDEPPSAFVVAVEKSRVLCIDQESLWALVKGSHEVASNILYILAKRVRDSNTAVVGGSEGGNIFSEYSIFDSLTGLYNRRWLENMFDRILKRCAKNNKTLSLVLLEIDNFKTYIAQHGYLAGDLALCAVAGTLRKYMRPHDLAARFSGAQFAILIPETEHGNVLAIIERLRQEIAKTRINVEGKFSLTKVTASFGYAQMQPDDTLERLVADAAAALSRASFAGGNRISQ